MKDFNILLKLYDISKVQNQPDYDSYSLTTMQSRFTELQKTCEIKECPNFNDDIVLLIFFSDQKRI